MLLNTYNKITLLGIFLLPFITVAHIELPKGAIPYYDSYVLLKQPYLKNIFTSFTSIETPRLILRKVQPSDVTDIFAITSDPNVTQYTSTLEFTKTQKEAEAIVLTMIDRYKQDLPTRWVIFHKADKKVVGICGFFEYVPMYARAELGYALARDYWGQGVGTEAAQAVIDFGFKYMNLNRIEATVAPENKASTHILEKIGMTYEGTLRHHIFKNDVYCDRKMYSVLKHEWAEKKSYE